jgi:membrane protein YqaA with SNARE-associated domain
LVYLVLFLHAFLAGTLLPFPSEATLITALTLGEGAESGLFVAASSGNILGAICNWYLGKYSLRWQDRKWFPIKPDKLKKATEMMAQRGYWVLLLSWVAVIGDPLTFAAGFLNLRLAIFLPLVAIGKMGRYAIIIYVAGGL